MIFTIFIFRNSSNVENIVGEVHEVDDFEELEKLISKEKAKELKKFI